MHSAQVSNVLHYPRLLQRDSNIAFCQFILEDFLSAINFDCKIIRIMNKDKSAQLTDISNKFIFKRSFSFTVENSKALFSNGDYCGQNFSYQLQTDFYRILKD